jgi:hypothetical protein
LPSGDRCRQPVGYERRAAQAALCQGARIAIVRALRAHQTPELFGAQHHDHSRSERDGAEQKDDGRTAGAHAGTIACKNRPQACGTLSWTAELLPSVAVQRRISAKSGW